MTTAIVTEELHGFLMDKEIWVSPVRKGDAQLSEDTIQMSRGEWQMLEWVNPDTQEAMAVNGIEEFHKQNKIYLWSGIKV